MDKIDKLLRELAQSLNTTVEYLWEILLRQQPIDAYGSFIIAIVLIIIAIVFVIWGAKSGKHLSTECSNYDMCSAKQTLWNIVIAVDILLTIIISILTVTGIKILLNPEFYALQDILRRVQ